ENIGGAISDTFAAGAVSGSHEVAGLVGLQYESAATIERSYATGTATGGVNTRGLLGMKMAGTCSGTYWDAEASGTSTDACGSAGLTTDEMQNQDKYVGWDFDDIWTMDSYPVLQCSPDSGEACAFSLGENDATIFDGTGAEFGNDPAASFPTFAPTVSGTSLQFAATDGIGKQVYVKYPLVSAGTISATTTDVTFTVSIDTSAYGNDSDIFVGITDGTNVLWTAYTNQYNEIPPGVYAASTILNGNIVQAINPPTVLLPSSPNLPWQVRFTLSSASSNITTSVDSKCWTGELDGLDRSAGLELLIGMGGGGFDWIQIDTLKLTADISSVIETVITTLQEALDEIDELDSSIFSNKNNEKNLTKGIEEVITLVEGGLYDDALLKLEGGSILGKADGCATSGAPDNNDWIRDCASQEVLYDLLMQAIGCLEDMTVLTPVPVVTSTATGRVWMDRNLGASRVATSSTDEDAYGDLYQWGRLTDGHERRTSDTTETTGELSPGDVPGHDKFILCDKPDPDLPGSDWRETPNNELWQGLNGVNNPCPQGFRLPTAEEFEAEIASWSSRDTAGAFASPLKLPGAGFRYYFSGIVHNNQGDLSLYWMSSIRSVQHSYYLRLGSDLALVADTRARADGMSVRCIQALPEEIETP
ncbi:MAG: hypothetical protein D3922_03755, partial [Candidatus Electrothrix sp. AR1]|nr:hypothetical protein [Candidatus Electrothrix sp. AR1]